MTTNSFTLYRIISGIILSENKILLVKNKDEVSNFHWSIPGGVVEKGESLKEALYREVREEVGLKVTDMNLAYIHESYIPEFSAHTLVTAFNVEVENYIPKINDPDGEIVDIQWVDMNKIENFITNETILRPLKDWLTNGKNLCKYYYDQNIKW